MTDNPADTELGADPNKEINDGLGRLYKPDELDEILEQFAYLLGNKEPDGHWWGHDTDLGTLAEEFANAKQAIQAWADKRVLKELEAVVLGTKAHPGGPQNYSRLAIGGEGTLEDRISTLKAQLKGKE